MAVAHLYGLKPVENETPRAPRMFVEPEDFASVAELARSIAGSSGPTKFGPAMAIAFPVLVSGCCSDVEGGSPSIGAVTT